MSDKVYRIAITGPESTGKTFLSEQLARHYQTEWVPEVARTYLKVIGRPYIQSDLLEIAQAQAKSEDLALLSANRMVFVDTELTNIKIWSEAKYQSCHPWISEEIKNRKYDLYLLLNVDTTWEFDPQREHPENREHFFDWFQKELKSQGANVEIIDGLGEKRLLNAIKAIEAFLSRS